MKASRSFWMTVAVLLLATAIYYPFSPGGSQARNMKRAQQHIEKALKPLIANDPRFADITFGTTTARGGCLRVWGEVKTDDDAEALRSLVASTHPPTEVQFGLLRAGTQPTGQRERRLEIPPLPGGG